MPFNLRQTSAVETFITIMEMHFIAHNVEKRIERMQNSFARGEMTKDEYEAEYGKLREMWTTPCLQGSKQHPNLMLVTQDRQLSQKLLRLFDIGGINYHPIETTLVCLTAFVLLH